MQQRGGILTLAVLDGGEKNDGLFSRMTLNTSASCFVSDCAGDAASPPGWATADIFHRESDYDSAAGRKMQKTHPEKEKTQNRDRTTQNYARCGGSDESGSGEAQWHGDDVPSSASMRHNL